MLIEGASLMDCVVEAHVDTDPDCNPRDERGQGEAVRCEFPKSPSAV